MFKGRENAISAERLKSGETCVLTGYGQSMTPRLKSGQSVVVEPITAETVFQKKDIVFCKVNGNYYLHLISALKGKHSFQISNNHGHVNGTISRNNIFGKVIKILRSDEIE